MTNREAATRNALACLHLRATAEKNQASSTKQDRAIRNFLRKVRNGQSINLATWAGRILDRKERTITEEELTRLVGLGFLN